MDENGTDFSVKNIQLKGNSNRQRLNYPDFMYICCETCTKWYHADAVELEESD